MSWLRSSYAAQQSVARKRWIERLLPLACGVAATIIDPQLVHGGAPMFFAGASTTVIVAGIARTIVERRC